jgi:heptosyltransferase I
VNDCLTMPDVLFIKTSSLGDVIHHMPALTEARRQRPDARFTWVVEEAFAPLARLHPAVDQVIPVASRRWRKSLTAAATWREMGRFIDALRERDYGTIIDTQGLLRTGLITRTARGTPHGYDSASIREPAASWFYDVRHSVSRALHAIDRNRILTGLALGYSVEGPPDYGLARTAVANSADRYAVLLHATARASKEWPEENWIALGKAIAARGLKLVLPWGNDRERGRSERLAAALPNAHVPAREPLDKVAQLIAGADVVIGVDTGLLHLAAALGVPLVGIFRASVPALTGPVGTAPLAIVGSDGRTPTVDDVRAALAQIGAPSGE